MKTSFLLAALSIILLMASYSADCQPTQTTTFVFYKLSLQYAPSACRSTLRCSKPVPSAIYVHGLWPQDGNDRGILPYGINPGCTTVKKLVLQGQPFQAALGKEPTFTTQKLFPVWPNLLDIQNQTLAQIFWGYEWAQHGLCSDYGDSPIDYFNSTIILKNALGDTSWFQHLPTGRRYKVEDASNTLSSLINGHKTVEISCTRDRSTGALLLTEIRICYDKAKPPSATRDCLKKFSGACNSGQDLILFPN